MSCRARRDCNAGRAGVALRSRLATIRDDGIEELMIGLDPHHAIGRMVGQTELKPTAAVRLSAELAFKRHLRIRRVDLADDPKPSFCDARSGDLDFRRGRCRGDTH